MRSLLTDETAEVVSSGIDAKLDLHGPIAPDTERLLKENNLDSWAEPKWQQTTQELIDSAGVNIFMSADVYDDVLKSMMIPAKNTVVWRIDDVDSSPLSAEEIFRQIKSEINHFMKNLRSANPEVFK